MVCSNFMVKLYASSASSCEMTAVSSVLVFLNPQCIVQYITR